MNRERLLAWADELRDIDESQFDINCGITGDYRVFPSTEMTGGPMEWLPVFFPNEWMFNRMGHPRLRHQKARTFSHWDVARWAEVKVSDVYQMCMPDAYLSSQVTPSMVADRICEIVNNAGQNIHETRKAA